MTTAPTTSETTDALIAVLEETGLRVGDGVKPDDGGWQGQRFNAYVVLHSLNGNTDGPTGDGDADVMRPHQVTAVGATRAQVEQLADRVRTALVGVQLRTSDRLSMPITVGTLSGARPDDTVQPRVWITSDVFDVDTTPAPLTGS